MNKILFRKLLFIDICHIQRNEFINICFCPSCLLPPPPSAVSGCRSSPNVPSVNWRMGPGVEDQTSFASPLHNTLQDGVWVVLPPALPEAGTLPHPYPPLLGWKHPN